MNALTTTTTAGIGVANSLLFDPVAFEQMQRIGGMLAMSELFPKHLREGPKEKAVANAVLVLNMASRLNEDVLTVAQAIYFVGGRPGWSSSYMIAKANQHGVFRDPIDWEVKGSGDSLSVTAFAVLAKTGRRVAVTCDMAMAKAEGWTKNPKYQSMPSQMLRYRSASALIRLYCPEIMVGLPTQIEVETQTIKDITPDEEIAKMQALHDPVVEDAEVAEAQMEIAPKAEPRKAGATADRGNEPAGGRDQTTAEARRKAEADMLADAAKTRAEPEPQGGQVEVDPETGEVIESETRARNLKAYEEITQDLIDGAPADATRTHFAAELDRMRGEAPDLFAQIERELAAAE